MINNDKSIQKYLKIRFVAIAVICILLFAFMGIFLNKATDKVIGDVGHQYMSEISSQLKQKFDTIVNLRAEQLEGLIERTPPTDEHWSEEMYRELQISAGVSDFIALGMYRYDGSIEMVYGGDIRITEAMTKNCNCEKGTHMLHLGYDEGGNKVFVMGMEVSYKMTNGNKSDVIFAVLPFEYFNEAMYLSAEDTKIISHIIDKDGTYIIGNGGANSYTNLYDRLKSDAIGINGKTKNDYITEIKKAIEINEDYSTLYKVGERVKRLYIMKISDKIDWYVLTDMPYEELGGSLNNLDVTRYTLMCIIVLVIIVVMLCVFLGYYRLSRRQVQELAKAREAADSANRAKSHFLTSMSHDIRTPMNAIMGMSDIAMNNIDNREKVEDCLKKVQLSSKHLLGLINDILDMTSIESGKLVIENKEVALSQVIGECANIMQEQIKAKKQEFEVTCENIVVENVYSDSTRLEQILINLLSNANKYTPEGGTIHLHIYQKLLDDKNRYVKTVFEVRDNGIGMSEDFVEKIFEKFTREDRKPVKNINGSGLGMAITKSIVDMMNGSIEVESTVGKGTVFRVELEMEVIETIDEDADTVPLEVVIEEGITTEQNQKEITLADKRFLLAEDNDINAEIVVEIMSIYGASIHRAVNGEECVRMFRESDIGYYDAVFMDVHMPVMDGYEATRNIRELDRDDNNVPIIAMTADVFSDNIENCKASGMNECITKPFNVNECIRVLGMHI